MNDARVEARNVTASATSAEVRSSQTGNCEPGGEGVASEIVYPPGEVVLPALIWVIADAAR